MAGMLPGVETARRRRIHQSSSITPPPPPPSSSAPYSHFSTTFSASYLERSRTYQVNEKLGQLAREAKERLDERLRVQGKSILRRNNSDLSEERINRRSGGNGREIKTEVFGSKKSRLMRWSNKLGWKSTEQEECVVCLEEYKVGENVVNLPCAHRFHSRCLLPWLQTNAHCPCCRFSIFS